MDWIAIGAIGEFVGGVVVIVTVVYFALQLRNSNQLAKASSELEWVHGLNEIWDRWSRPEVIDAIRSGFQSFDDLINKRFFICKSGRWLTTWRLLYDLLNGDCCRTPLKQ